MSEPVLSTPTARAGLAAVVPVLVAAGDVPVPLGIGGELVAQVLLEAPVCSALFGSGVGERERLLAASWLVGFRSPRTRAAYAADLAVWLGWCAGRGVGVLEATRVVLDLWTRQQLAGGVAASSMSRRLSALSSFYRHLAHHGLVTGNPTTGVRRPRVDPDQSATVGLDRDQARALLSAADGDTGPQAKRGRAAIRLLLHNALRVDELANAKVDDLGYDRGHRTLRLVRKGGAASRVALAPATVAAVADYLAERATQAAVSVAELGGPLLATATGRRLDQKALWRLVRRLAQTAGIPGWAALSPHSLRHTAITLALDAGVSLRDVQDYAGHRDPRTTRRYDHTRGSLDRHAAYTVAAYLA